jgi:sensor histidine kinase regulating citrate/malate metabolism
MASYIVYRSQQLESLLLSFSPDEEFRGIVDSFSEIGYPPLPVNPELVSFALLELVSNSIRAHREKGVPDKVNVSLRAEGGLLRATVLDAGRGFDPSLLPYDLDAAPDDVDIMSDGFSSYRQRHGGSRFGMGIYVAKKTFRSFSLCFVDSQSSPCPWFSGKVRGTRIELALPLRDGPAPAQGGSGEDELLESLEEANA